MRLGPWMHCSPELRRGNLFIPVGCKLFIQTSGSEGWGPVHVFKEACSVIFVCLCRGVGVGEEDRRRRREEEDGEVEEEGKREEEKEEKERRRRRRRRDEEG